MLIDLDDRLVSMGMVCLPDYGDCFAMGWHSTDGMTWTPAPIPGDLPSVGNVVATPDGLVAVGFVGSRKWRAAVWSSSDGTAWDLLRHRPCRRYTRRRSRETPS